MIFPPIIRTHFTLVFVIYNHPISLPVNGSGKNYKSNWI